jgi:hypothetical protein
VNTKTAGDISEAFIAAHLLEQGHAVLKPLGDNLRYDLVIDRGNGFERIQVKTGRIDRGAIEFKTASSYAHRGGKKVGYVGQIEAFAVWEPLSRKAYMVPIALATTAAMRLRVEPSKNNQTAGVNMASDFEI